MDSKRKYLQSHPWLKFKIDLSKATPPRLWLLLGEAKSKCESLGRVPLPPATARELHGIYLVKGLQGTTAIEGNTLTEKQIHQILEKKLELPPSQEYLKREVENILTACEDIVDRALQGESTDLTPELVRRFNGQVLSGLELPQEVEPGGIRSHSVGVVRYLGAPHQDCEYLLDRLCSWLNELGENKPGLDEQIIRSVLAHLYLAWIHPFGDGNGRTARLMEFHILVNAGVPTPAAHLLSNHYNTTKATYLRTLDEASHSGGDVLPFLLYAIEGLVEQLHQQLIVVQAHQITLSWRDFVYEHFRDRTAETDRRRRDLLLALSWKDEPVPRREIRTVSPKIEEAYRDKTGKTVTRDLNWLVKKMLLKEDEKGYSARTEIILGFLPAQAVN